jgi:hypothetical protein
MRPCRSSEEAILPLEKFPVFGFRTYEERNSLSLLTDSESGGERLKAGRKIGRTSRPCQANGVATDAVF